MGNVLIHVVSGQEIVESLVTVVEVENATEVPAPSVMETPNTTTNLPRVSTSPAAVHTSMNKPMVTPTNVPGGGQPSTPTEPPSNTPNVTNGTQIVTSPTTTSEETPTEEVSEETQSSRAVFLILAVLGVCVFTVYFLIHFKLHFFPESIAVVIIGAFVGLVLFTAEKLGAQHTEMLGAFNPNQFFLIMLPPIIFESGYSLHKGNFFQNLGSIVMFAVFGTAISAVIVGGGLYVLGLISVVPSLDIYQSFTFGCLISAVDPVATLAIFHALDLDPTLNMLVFGESVLNDAVSIVMTKTVLNAEKMQGRADVSVAALIFGSLGNFLLMFLGSAIIGILFALVAALTTKHIHLRKTPSLEIAFLLVFSFLPYFISESLDLSGIMAILFCGIVMSHYAHHNLSPVTQITIQQILRTVAFMAETCVFAYLGLALFTQKLSLSISLVIWSIVLILLGRVFNIFPLSALVNRFRTVRISFEMQFVMWFSGLRGAVAFALVLTLEGWEESTLTMLTTTTLIIVLFTILLLGGSTLPLLKFLRAYHERRGRRKNRRRELLTLSKTEDQGAAVVEPTPDKHEPPKGFVKFDEKYFKPFFLRHCSKEEWNEARIEIEKATGPLFAFLDVRNSDSEQTLTELPSHLGSPVASS